MNEATGKTVAGGFYGGTLVGGSIAIGAQDVHQISAAQGQSEVGEQLSRLDHMLHRLEDTRDMLRGRLHPVTRPVPMAGTNAAKSVPEAALSDVANVIRIAGSRVSTVVEEIHELVGALAI